MMVTCINQACKSLVAWSNSHCPWCHTRVPRNLWACKHCHYCNPEQHLVCHHCMERRTDERTYLLDVTPIVPTVPKTPEKEKPVARIATLHIKVNLNDPQQVKRVKLMTSRHSGITVSKVRPQSAWKELFGTGGPAAATTTVIHSPQLPSIPRQTHFHVVYIKGCEQCERIWNSRHDHSLPITYRSSCVACKAGHTATPLIRHTHADNDPTTTWSNSCLACPVIPPSDTARAGATSSSAPLAPVIPTTTVRSMHERLPKPDKIEEVMMPLVGNGEAGVEDAATGSAQ